MLDLDLDLDIKKVVDSETAKNEFKRFVKSMGLRPNLKNENTVAIVETVLEAIEEGSIVIDENGKLTFIPKYSGDIGPFVFHPATGSTIISGNVNINENAHVGVFAALGELTKRGHTIFTKMSLNDVHICEAIAYLFLVR